MPNAAYPSLTKGNALPQSRVQKTASSGIESLPVKSFFCLSSVTIHTSFALKKVALRATF